MLVHGNPQPQLPRRVVVMGAGGFIGGAVSRRLEAAGVPVLCLGRGEVDLLATDAPACLAARLQPGDVFVAASAIAPCKNAVMLRDNMTLVANMLAGLAGMELAHVVNVSSDAVYLDQSEPLSERSHAAPGSAHGAMHLAREVLFRAEVKAPLAIVRPTLVYGAGDPHNGYGPNKFRRHANRGEDIVLFGEGEEKRDHVLVEDVAELIMRIVLHRSTGILNIATGTVTSFRTLAEQAVALAGAKVAIKGSPRVGPMPHNGWRPFDAAGVTQAFPDFRFTPLAEGMERAQKQEFG